MIDAPPQRGCESPVRSQWPSDIADPLQPVVRGPEQICRMNQSRMAPWRKPTFAPWLPANDRNY
jgi:hypothetical protein